MSKTGAITSEDITFDLSGMGAVTASDLRLLIDKDGGGTFADETVAGGGVKSGFTFVSGTLYKIGGVNLLDGERFTLGTINSLQTPLPIELISFNAKPCNDEVCLDWATATETNNDFFNVEKSKDGINFISIEQITGSGNSISYHTYSTVDAEPYPGISYYRLRQTDYNGHITYSEIRTVDFISVTNFNLDVFPNPSSGSVINIDINGSRGESVLVELYDTMGRKIYSKASIMEGDGKNKYEIIPDEKLSAGNYMIVAVGQANRLTKEIMVK